MVLFIVSNPPPSPVTDCNRENSSDFDTNDIQHVNVTSPEKSFSEKVTITAPTPLVPAPQPTTYDDDFLDMNCDDMDLF